MRLRLKVEVFLGISLVDIDRIPAVKGTPLLEMSLI
jgi:hypothetical protein